MGKMFGGLLAVSLAAAIIVYLLMTKQERHETKTDLHSATMYRDLYEGLADDSRSESQQKRYLARAEEADKRIRELESKEAGADAQQENDMQEVIRKIADYKASEARPGALAGAAGDILFRLIIIVLLIAIGYFFWQWQKTKREKSRAD